MCALKDIDNWAPVMSAVEFYTCSMRFSRHVCDTRDWYIASSKVAYAKFAIMCAMKFSMDMSAACPFP